MWFRFRVVLCCEITCQKFFRFNFAKDELAKLLIIYLKTKESLLRGVLINESLLYDYVINANKNDFTASSAFYGLFCSSGVHGPKCRCTYMNVEIKTRRRSFE